MLNYLPGFYKIGNKDYSSAMSLNGNSKQRRQQRRKFEREVDSLVKDLYAS